MATTPVYFQFPHYYVSITGNTQNVYVGSGILHAVIIGKTTSGTVTIADTQGTIMAFQTSTPAGTYLFDCSYGGTLTVATTASDFVCVVAGTV